MFNKWRTIDGLQKALQWTPTEKRKKRNTKDDMERDNPETHQPDECDVG